MRPSRIRTTRSAALGDRRVVGDQHDGQALVLGEPREQADDVVAASPCRGCRSARRRAARAGRSRARGRSPPAAARRRRAATGRWPARSAEADPLEQLGGRGGGARPRGSRRGASAASTFCAAVSVGIRLNCWKMKPSVSRRSRASVAVAHRGEVAALELARARSSGGRARRAAAAASSCPSPTGPATTRNSPCADLEVDAVDGRDRAVAAADVVQGVERGHQAPWSVDVAEGVGGAQAGGAQAADRAGDQAAEQREADRERDQAEVDGRVERDRLAARRDRRAGRGRRSRPPPGPARRAARRALRRGDGRLERRSRTRRPARRRRSRSATPKHAAERALGQRLARDLADDVRPRPADRLQRAELADALGHRGERQQRGDQEGGGERDDRQRRAELAGEALGVGQRAADAVGEVGRGGDRGARQRRADRLLDAPPRRRPSPPAPARVFTRPLRSASFCSCAELDVDVGGLAAERRAREPDDRRTSCRRASASRRPPARCAWRRTR